MSLAYVNGEYVEIDDISAIQEYTAEDYGNIVEDLVRQKYALGQELAIQRQRYTKVQEFNEYFDYCENCKLEAKRLCNMEID